MNYIYCPVLHKTKTIAKLRNQYGYYFVEKQKYAYLIR